MPDCPDFHQVRGAAAQNEESEHPEDPIEGNVAALSNEVNKCDRNAIVRKCNETVRDDVQADDLRIPQVAGSVGQKIRRR